MDGFIRFRLVLKILTVIGIVATVISIVVGYVLLGIEYSAQPEMGTPLKPPYKMMMTTNILSSLLQLFMAYGFLNLYLFLQKNSIQHLKKFGIILLSYTLLKIVNGTLSSVLLSWHLEEEDRLLSVNFDEMTFIFVGLSLLIIYLSNLLAVSKNK